MKLIDKYTFNIKGTILTIIPNQKRNELLIQYVEKQKNQLGVLDLTQFKFIKCLYVLPEFHLLLMCSGNKFLIQEYDNTQFPIIKKLYLLDYVLDSKYEFENSSFIQVINSSVFELLNQSNVTLKKSFFDIESGKEVQNPFPQNSKLNFPQRFGFQSDYFSIFQDFISKYDTREIENYVDYLEWGDLILISYYICIHSSIFNNYLLIINSKGELILSDTLGENLLKMKETSFYLMDEKLILLNHDNEIQVWDLNQLKI